MNVIYFVLMKRMAYVALIVCTDFSLLMTISVAAVPFFYILFIYFFVVVVYSVLSLSALTFSTTICYFKAFRFVLVLYF